MYSPPAFRDTDPATLHQLIHSTPVANLVTATADGLFATPLPLFLVAGEGPHGTLYGHVAKANPQWRAAPITDALADAPSAFIESQLRGIVGVRLPIGRLEGKRKLSQNRPAADRLRVARELAASDRPADRAVAAMMPLPSPSDV
jgi:predicted FMN-binding regulatory protein PaiB